MIIVYKLLFIFDSFNLLIYIYTGILLIIVDVDRLLTNIYLFKINLIYNIVSVFKYLSILKNLKILIILLSLFILIYFIHSYRDLIFFRMNIAMNIL